MVIAGIQRSADQFAAEAERFIRQDDLCCPVVRKRAALSPLSPDTIFQELQLPLPPLEDKKTTLGIRLTSAKDVAVASFLASCAAPHQLCNRFLPPYT